jgi:hypothetical protein
MVEANANDHCVRSYQNYQDEAVSIQLTDVVREEGKCVLDDS